MPSKFIVKEFVLDIVAKKIQKPISWAAFVKETNTNQHSKFFKRLEKMEM